MELRRYWNIVWRYRLIVVGLPLLVGLLSVAIWRLQTPNYTASARAQIALVSPQVTAPDGAYFRFDNYYNYLATEYAVDDLVEVINGNAFAAAVTATLHGPEFNFPVPDGEVAQAIKAERQHRVLELQITANDRGKAVMIARAVLLTLQRDPLKYFSKANLAPQQNAAVIVVQTPDFARSDRVRRGLNVAIQTVVALFAGLGLAFLLDHLNDRLRDADTTRATLELPVLGQIPAPGRRGR